MVDFRALLEAAFTGDADRIETEAGFIGIPHSVVMEAKRSAIAPRTYDDGYEAGHEDGWDDGYAAGQAEGYTDGWEACQRDVVTAVAELAP